MNNVWESYISSSSICVLCKILPQCFWFLTNKIQTTCISISEYPSHRSLLLNMTILQSSIPIWGIWTSVCLNINSKHFTYSKKKMRPPLFAMSQMFPNPPKSTDPWAMIAIRPAITTKVWNVSVHTTARRPPCSNIFSFASELMKLRDFQRFERVTNTFKSIWRIATGIFDTSKFEILKINCTLLDNKQNSVHFCYMLFSPYHILS